MIHGSDKEFFLCLHSSRCLQNEVLLIIKESRHDHQLSTFTSFRFAWASRYSAIPSWVAKRIKPLTVEQVPVDLFGTGQATKTDDFWEKFQMAFDPPFIFGKFCCNFFEKHWGKSATISNPSLSLKTECLNNLLVSETRGDLDGQTCRNSGCC